MNIQFLIKYIIANGKPEHIFLIILVWLALSIYNKIKKVYIRSLKLMLLTEQCPSISKANVAWLLDDSRNSKPPDGSLCTMACVECVEKKESAKK